VKKNKVKKVSTVKKISTPKKKAKVKKNSSIEILLFRGTAVVSTALVFTAGQQLGEFLYYLIN
jgi:hypothetical protein